MSDFKVLISDKMSANCVAALRKHAIEVEYKPGLAAADLLEEIASYDGLIVRSATKVTSKIIDRAEKLKVIGRAGSGVDNIDVPKASEKGIAVLNSRGGNTISAAEHTFAMMISLARNIPAAHISMRDGKWERSAFTGVELFGKKLGIIGLGQIGKEVAKRAQVFGMKIFSYDPFLADSDFTSLDITQASVEDILRQCDFMTLHLPINAETRNLISDKAFDICNPQLRMINVARGGIIDEVALVRAIKGKKIAGAAIDVFAEEPPGDTPLSHFANVITTPHLGASTIDAQERIAVEIADNVVSYLREKTAVSIVNENDLK